MLPIQSSTRSIEETRPIRGTTATCGSADLSVISRGDGHSYGQVHDQPAISPDPGTASNEVTHLLRGGGHSEKFAWSMLTIADVAHSQLFDKKTVFSCMRAKNWRSIFSGVSSLHKCAE